MDARQDADLDADRADFLVAAAVRADLVAQDALAHDLLLDAVERLRQRLRLRTCSPRAATSSFFSGGERAVLRFLAGVLRQASVMRSPSQARGRLFHRRIGKHRGVLELGLAQFGAHLVLERDERLHGLVAQLQRLQHHVLGQLVGAGLHHQDGVGGAGHAQIEGAGGHLA